MLSDEPGADAVVVYRSSQAITARTGASLVAVIIAVGGLVACVSGQSDDAEFAGSPYGERTNGIVSSYLSGRGTLREVAATIRIPQPSVIDENLAIQRQTKWQEGYGSLQAEIDVLVGRGYDNSEGDNELSVSELASSLAALYITSSAVHLRQELDYPRFPLWMTYALWRPDDSYHTYARDLQRDAVRAFEKASIGHLVTWHREALNHIYCAYPEKLDITNVAIEALLNSWEPDAAIQTEKYWMCRASDSSREWPLPYSLDDAFSSAELVALNFLEHWIQDNLSKKPTGLKVIP